MTISNGSTIFDVTEAHPETIAVFVDAGFRRMHEPQLRARFGATITVETAAYARGLQPDELIGRLNAAVSATEGAAARTDATPGGDPNGAPRPIRIVGLVPCPVRVPMTNVLEAAIREFTAETGLDVEYDLQAAYTGTDWIEQELPAQPNAADLPEIFLSAGFRLFFTDPRLRALRDAGAFTDRTGWNGVNAFAADNDLADPERRFAVIGVVPAVFMVNREVLGDRPIPRSWSDILTSEYENSLALPIGDFDLFDALLLGIRRRFGDDGVRQLARNMFQQMHPAQMVAGASGRGGAEGRGATTDQPLITIMPFFFTRTINEHSPLIPVWPEDGALAAPILLVTRADRPEVQPLIDTLAGEAMSRVLSRLGLFPSAHPSNDDFASEEHPLQWPGWDLLLAPDLGDRLAHATALFERERASRLSAPVAGGIS